MLRLRKKKKLRQIQPGSEYRAFMRVVARQTESFLSKTFTNIYVDGPKRRRSEWRAMRTMPVCTHRSQTDYFILGQFLSKLGLQNVRFAAGDNLTELPIIGPQFRKWGAFPVARARAMNRTYLRNLCEQVTGMLVDGENVVVFPEGGRSYQGHMMEMRYGMIGACLLAQWRRPEQEYSFLPVAISYERLPELLYFDMLQKGKKIRDANGHVLSRVRGNLYYFGADILAFSKFCVANKIRVRYGDVFIDYCEPVAVNELVDLKALYNSRARDDFSALRTAMQRTGSMLYERFLSLYRLLPIHVLCTVLEGRERCTIAEARSAVADIVASLQARQRNTKSLTALREEEIVDNAMRQLATFRAVHVRRNTILVRKPFVVTYHAASIQPHKEASL